MVQSLAPPKSLGSEWIWYPSVEQLSRSRFHNVFHSSQTFTSQRLNSILLSQPLLDLYLLRNNWVAFWIDSCSMKPSVFSPFCIAKLVIWGCYKTIWRTLYKHFLLQTKLCLAITIQISDLTKGNLSHTLKQIFSNCGPCTTGGTGSAPLW